MKKVIVSASMKQGVFTKGKRTGESWSRLTLVLRNNSIMSCGVARKFRIWGEDFPTILAELNKIESEEKDGIKVWNEEACTKLPTAIRELQGLQFKDAEYRPTRTYIRVDETNSPKFGRDGLPIIKGPDCPMFIVCPYIMDDMDGKWVPVTGYELETIARRDLEFFYVESTQPVAKNLLDVFDNPADEDEQA